MAAENVLNLSDFKSAAGNYSSTFESAGNRSTTVEHVNFVELTAYQAGMALITYVLPVVIAFGTIGNVTSFLVLMRKRMRVVTVYLYLAVLACADTSVLYLSAFKTWLRVLTGFEILHVSEAGCKIVMFLFLLGLYMSAWLIVLITLDRCIVVWFPLKACIICTRRRSVISLIILTLTVSVYNMHVLWTMDLNSPAETGIPKQCAPWMDNYFMVNVFPYLNLASYSILPFIIVLLLNAAIIWRIYRSRSAGGIGHGEHQRLQIQVRTTYMLLTVTFMWLLLTGPFTIWSLVGLHGQDPHTMAAVFLGKTVCFIMMYVNHSINFYLYCLTGRKFRQEFLSCACCRGRHAETGEFMSQNATFLRSAGSGRKTGSQLPMKKWPRQHDKVNARLSCVAMTTDMTDA